MRRAWISALVLGFTSIASVIGCASPGGEPYQPALRRNPPPSPAKQTEDESVVESEAPKVDAPPPKAEDEPSADEEEDGDEDEEESDGKKLGSKCSDDAECASNKCIALADELAICGPP